MKISELTELTELTDNDVLAGVDTSAEETKKIPLSALKDYCTGEINALLDTINGEVV